MTDEETLQAFVQSVYLARYNRYIDDITDEDGREEVLKTVDWLNNFLGELELEADWQYLRENDSTLGTVSSSSQTFPLPDGVRKLVVDEDRPLKIVQDGTTVSSWMVVDPDKLTEATGSIQDRVTTVGDTILFSRELNDTELNGTVTGDVIEDMPRVIAKVENDAIVAEDIEVLELIKPQQLLVFGIAKNATLPDIVQGGLSPSFVERYADLLEKAVMENNASAAAEEAFREDLSGIRGVY